MATDFMEVGLTGSVEAGLTDFAVFLGMCIFQLEDDQSKHQTSSFRLFGID